MILWCSKIQQSITQVDYNKTTNVIKLLVICPSLTSYKQTLFKKTKTKSVWSNFCLSLKHFWPQYNRNIYYFSSLRPDIRVQTKAMCKTAFLQSSPRIHFAYHDIMARTQVWLEIFISPVLVIHFSPKGKEQLSENTEQFYLLKSHVLIHIFKRGIQNRGIQNQ